MVDMFHYTGDMGLAQLSPVMKARGLELGAFCLSTIGKPSQVGNGWLAGVERNIFQALGRE